MLHERDDHEAAAIGQSPDLEGHPAERGKAAHCHRHRARREQGDGPSAPALGGAAAGCNLHQPAGDEDQDDVRTDDRRGHGPGEEVKDPPGPGGPGAARPSPAGRQEDEGGIAARRPERPRPAPAAAPCTQSGGWADRNNAERARMMASPGAMKQTPPISPPSRPRKRQAQKMASWVDAGPGRRLVAEMPSSNSGAVSQWWSSTQSWRSRAMWAGGPPNPMTPMRPHSPRFSREERCRWPGQSRSRLGLWDTVAAVNAAGVRTGGTPTIGADWRDTTTCGGLCLAVGYSPTNAGLMGRR